MPASPLEVQLSLTPQARFDVIDVARRAVAEVGDSLFQYRRALYCSYHTTAGFLEQSLSARLLHRREYLVPFIRAFQVLFPADASYRHDQLHLRTELSDRQKETEPKNADSHLTFMGSGLKNCVTYANRPGLPVYFIDLDGVSEWGARRRKASILAFDREETVDSVTLSIPVSAHPIDSVNLRDPQIGLMARISELLDHHGVDKGSIDIALEPEERHAALTVNEFETLLMRYDVAEVLQNPFRFLASEGRSILRHPLKIPVHTLDHAKYDLVQVFNELMDAFRVSQSVVEKLLSRFLAVPASRLFGMKRSVSLLVNDDGSSGRGRIVQGTYQSPILVQWREAPRQSRTLQITIKRFA